VEGRAVVKDKYGAEVYYLRRSGNVRSVEDALSIGGTRIFVNGQRVGNGTRSGR
jgi:hypothetical protein